MIGLIVFNFLFSTILDFINDSNWNDSIPESVKDFYSKEAYVKAKTMQRKRANRTYFESLKFLYNHSHVVFVWIWMVKPRNFDAIS